MFRVMFRVKPDDKWAIWEVTTDKQQINGAVRRLKAGGVAEIEVIETTQTVIFHWERDHGTLIKP